MPDGRVKAGNFIVIKSIEITFDFLKVSKQCPLVVSKLASLFTMSFYTPFYWQLNKLYGNFLGIGTVPVGRVETGILKPTLISHTISFSFSQ